MDWSETPLDLQAMQQHMQASHPLFSYSFPQSHSGSLPAVNVRCSLEAHKGGETFNGDFVADRNAMSKVPPPDFVAHLCSQFATFVTSPEQTQQQCILIFGLVSAGALLLLSQKCQAAPVVAAVHYAPAEEAAAAAPVCAQGRA